MAWTALGNALGEIINASAYHDIGCNTFAMVLDGMKLPDINILHCTDSCRTRATCAQFLKSRHAVKGTS